MKKVFLTLKVAMVFVAFTVFFTMCRKDGTPQNLTGKNFGPQASGSLPNAPNSKYIEEQLRWIARGYAELNHIHSSSNFLGFINNHLTGKDYYIDDHQNIKDNMQAAISGLGIDLEDEIFHSINRITFHNGEYDRGYFYGFIYDNCQWTTGLSIVDTPNLSLPVLYTYESFDSNSDSTYGYFWNTSNNGHLDSILLTSETFEDYYILAVIANGPCSDPTAMRNGDCNNNGVCERMRGENDNCADCIFFRQPNEKRLKIVWARINEDKNMFDEAWAQNKYEIAWDWCVANGTQGLIKNRAFGEFELAFEYWKRRQVPIKRKSSQSIKGTVTQKFPSLSSASDIMFERYDPDVHDIYVHFHEFDKRFTGVTEPVKTISGSTITFPTGFSTDWLRIEKGGTFHQGGFGFGGIIHIPAGSAWLTETINGKPHMVIEASTPNLEEITIKLAYEL